MNDTNRVFITGVSALSASGLSVDATWDAILAGHSAVGELKTAGLASWSHRLGGELLDYQPMQHLPDRKLSKFISRHDAIGLHAVVQAVEDSGLLAYQASVDDVTAFNQDTAVYVSSPGNKYYQQYDFLPLMAKTNCAMQAFAEQLFSEVHPMWLLRILPNNVLAYTGITYGFTGENHNIVNHAAGGIQAILEAYHAIRSGRAARAVVAAYDTGIEPQTLFYYQQLGVLSAQHLRPFDRSHDGTLLGEGAAAMVLESEASARLRNRVPYAELHGGYSATEGEGLFSLHAQGQPLAALLRHTLASHAISPADLDLIVAHGNGNPKSDVSEARAICAVIEQADVPVTAFKWAMGHMLCAAGLIDAVLTTRALQTQTIPGIATLDMIAPDCRGLNLAANHRRLAERARALLINRGFAGINACLLLQAYDV